MSVTAETVRQLRERTGAGMMECKKALVTTAGDLDAAAELMRKQGLAKADKKAARVAAEGVIVVERSTDGRAAAMVELNCETDFVAREQDFRRFAADVVRLALTHTVRADLEALLAAELAAGESVDERRRALVAKIGENISVRRTVVLETRVRSGLRARHAASARWSRSKAVPTNSPMTSPCTSQPAIHATSAPRRCRPMSSPRSARLSAAWLSRKRKRPARVPRSLPRWSKDDCARRSMRSRCSVSHS